MHTCLLNVLHDAADDHLFTVRNAIHVYFNRMVQEEVEQYRAVVRHAHGFAHVLAQFVGIVHHLHGATAQYVRWTHHQWVADFGRQGNGFFVGARGAVFGLAQAQIFQDLLEAFAVFGSVNAVGRRTDDVHTIFNQGIGQFQWRLATVMHDQTVRLFYLHDFQHVFQGQRLEIQAV